MQTSQLTGSAFLAGNVRVPVRATAAKPRQQTLRVNAVAEVERIATNGSSKVTLLLLANCI